MLSIHHHEAIGFGYWVETRVGSHDFGTSLTALADAMTAE
jgi:hypothetical protein